MIVVDLNKKKIKELRMSASGAVDAGLKIHQDEYETYSLDVYDPKNALVFAAGPFAHPDVQGGNRGVVSFRSPLTGGFFVSSAGNLGHYISLTGDTAVTIVGRAEKPSIVVLYGDKAGTTLRIFELSEFDDLAGNVFAFDAFLRKELGDVYNGAPFRAVIAGLASANTDYGALVSVDPVMNTPDFFGRGGAGSVMVRAHNVYAVVFGGEADPAFSESDEFKKIVEKATGKDFIQAITEATTKYRLSPKDGIGGTILNWAHMKTVLPAYNWQMIYMSEKDRERLWEEKIAPAVERLRQMFKEGTMKSKTCGEKCAAVCKKIWDERKLDYEPITSLGAQMGIFDLEKVREIVHLADALGFDAIEAGNVVSWVLELRERGIITLEGVPETSMRPFEVDEDKQAEAVKRILLAIARGDLPMLSGGIRRAADQIKPEAREFAVYIPFSSGGEIVPPQYWVPGFLVPLPLHGKFMTYYGSDWLEPYELGKKSWERFHAELMIENAGFCRFHRGWVEKVLPEVYKRFYNIGIDIEIERLATKIIQYQRAANAEAQIPESQRSRDLIAAFARLHDQGEWAEKLQTEDGLQAYFLEVRRGISNAKSTILKG
ncbi:MAG: hypothetical protein PWP76_488 [Candidatus Diapherotrites archaeon]|nr:hypothetical protein [Candidatus Diapherotrites archaeon]